MQREVCVWMTLLEYIIDSVQHYVLCHSDYSLVHSLAYMKRDMVTVDV